MPNKPTVLVDINVLLDVLQKREPFFENSAKLLSLIENGKVKGFIASHSVTTLFYLIKKDRSSAEAKATITNILQFMKVAAIDQSTIEQALNLDYRDFEDAVQMISAVQCKADCLITRNIKDYQPPLLSVLQPVDFLATL
jgi:predicted nucleic acid-binding protein